MVGEPGFDVSYSGLKTSVINHVRKIEAAGEQVNVADIAASFQQAVVDIEVAKTMSAVDQTMVDSVFLCGGVAANSGLRTGLEKACLDRSDHHALPGDRTLHRQRRHGGRLRHRSAEAGQ